MNNSGNWQCSPNVCLDASSAGLTTTLVCGADLNGDGVVSPPDELKDCIVTSQGNFCPVGATSCNTTTTAPGCPTGTTYNSVTKQCESTPTCSSGTYDPATNQCKTSGSYAATLSGAITNSFLWSCYSFQGNQDHRNDRLITADSTPAPVNAFGCYWGGYASNCNCSAIGWVAPTNAVGLPLSSVPLYQTMSSYWIGAELINVYNTTGGSFMGYPLTPFALLSSSPAGVGSNPVYSQFTQGGGVLGYTWPSKYVGGTYTCPSGGTLSGTTCTTTTYTAATCPAGTTLDGASDKCIAIPTCTNGTFDATNNACLTATCPLGGQYACMNISGSWQCSANSCANISTTSPVTDTQDPTYYKDDGTVDPSTGQCQGQILIFNGKPGECRTPGVSTMFFNCCSYSDSSFLIFQKNCSDNEREADMKREGGSCHYIGDYCKVKWPLIGCVQSAKSYCCFNSKLGRIIQEQGRMQLKAFAPNGNWGTPQSPNCIGLTPEQMQMLDMSKIDFSEYVGEVQSKAAAQITNIQNSMQEKVNAKTNP